MSSTCLHRVLQGIGEEWREGYCRGRRTQESSLSFNLCSCLSVTFRVGVAVRRGQACCIEAFPDEKLHGNTDIVLCVWNYDTRHRVKRERNISNAGMLPGLNPVLTLLLAAVILNGSDQCQEISTPSIMSHAVTSSPLTSGGFLLTSLELFYYQLVLEEMPSGTFSRFCLPKGIQMLLFFTTTCWISSLFL